MFDIISEIKRDLLKSRVKEGLDATKAEIELYERMGWEIMPF